MMLARLHPILDTYSLDCSLKFRTVEMSDDEIIENTLRKAEARDFSEKDHGITPSTSNNSAIETAC
jgi:hypothetical protein